MGTESNTARARAKLGGVRQRIEVWRRTRAKRSPMPQELGGRLAGTLVAEGAEVGVAHLPQ